MNQLDIAQQYLNDIRSGFINQFKEKIDLTNQYTGPFACIECRLMIAFISCKELLLSLIYTDLMALPGTTPTLSEDVVPKYSRPQSKRKSNNMRQIIEFNRYIKYAIEGLANDFLSTYFDFQQDILKLSTNGVLGDSYNKSLQSTEF
ncbi:unnamed protein product [Rotaria magnacalcarata]|uniref:Uncharacterized protein n=1 Tax=Rotaria magnacalcarata TaxID=392030 RepID=A0A8S3F7V2_9BILA|nr:unnamed protein product [Rotaria magnacalcarata]